jgi:hypothetical protein
MHINTTEIKNRLYSGYQFASEWVGKFLHHSVRLLKPVFEQIRQDKRLAVPLVVGMNILFLKIALKVTEFAHEKFDRLLGPFKDQSVQAQGVRSFVLLSILILPMIGMNYVLHRGFQLPLSPMLTTATSVATCVSYVAFELWRVKAKQNKPVAVGA